MTLSDEECAELPRELFAMAARRLEHGSELAMEGQGRHPDPERPQALCAQLHDIGKDITVIADAIAVLVQQDTNR